MIPYGRQSISQADIDAVVEVLRSDFLTQGPAVEAFEDAVASYCGVKHAIAVSSGTAALHLAATVAGISAGGLLWTSPLTFVASANCARFLGADVDFVDIDPCTLDMSADALEAKLEIADRAGRLPNVVTPVHFGGVSCDMRRIHALSQKYGFTVIEDACHAIGGRYEGQAVGGCAYSSMTVFSFHPVKIVTTGEGGMVVTNDDALARRLRLLRSHGITREGDLMMGSAEGGWYYEMLELGFNYRLTDIQASLGTSQMRRIDEFVERRNVLAAMYSVALDGVAVKMQVVPENTRSAYHLFVIQLERADRALVYEDLRKRGVGVNVHYIPVHLQPYYRALGFQPGDFPSAEAYYRGALTLPLFPAMHDEDVAFVVQAIERSLQ